MIPDIINFLGLKDSEEGKKLPKYFIRGLSTAMAFSEFNYRKNKPKGLLILFGEPNQIKRVTENSRSSLKKEILDKYRNPILFSNKIFEIYDEMGLRDGGIAFDKKGNLIDTEIYVEQPSLKYVGTFLKDIISAKGRIGARHISGAYACLKGLDVIVVSEEAGTVIPFKGRRVLNELVYDPRKKSA